jgi:tripartite-type tricarboxylate transporter receptor subunit TctC
MLLHLFRKLSWDHAIELVPVMRIVNTPLVVMGGASSPYKIMQDLLDADRKNPDKLIFGSGGVGNSTHSGGASCSSRTAKSRLCMCPYMSVGETMLGVVSGQSTC